jgi:hypothetical protein
MIIIYSIACLYLSINFLKAFSPEKNESLYQKLYYYIGGSISVVSSLSPFWSSYFDDGSLFAIIALLISVFLMMNRMCFILKKEYYQIKMENKSEQDEFKAKKMWTLAKITRMGCILGLVIILFVVYG